MPPHPFIALTDFSWFTFLAERAAREDGRVHEVNFWSPKAQRPMKRMALGTPVFFRLKAPRNAIAGYGFFAHFDLVALDRAWSDFGTGNGDPDEIHFLERIGRFRGVDLLRGSGPPPTPLGCTILRDAVFWPAERWIPWGADQGWATNIVQGKTEDDPARASRLLAEIQFDHMALPEDLAAHAFRLVEADERKLRLARTRPRVGQGAFRSRLLEAYGRRCAITGEHTEPVLDAAHIQPYLGPRSNHVQNGLLLTKEFHTLFDAGYVTVTPDLVVRVSQRLRTDWQNGHRYYPVDGQPLLIVPEGECGPSPEALAWHGERVWRG
jgi:putative restriction endonuclease